MRDVDLATVGAERSEPQSISHGVITSFEYLNRDEWDDFVLSVGGDIYMTYDWCRIWWRYYGARRRLWVFVFRASHEIVGLMPMFIEDLWLGPVRLRVAKLLGADHAMTLCNPPVRKEWATLVFERLLEQLVGEERCDVVSVGPIAGTYEPTAALDQVCERRKDLVAELRELVHGCHAMFTLPGSFEEYFKTLGQKQRQNYRRQLRFFQEKHKVSTEVVGDLEGGLAAFDAFRKAHEVQWRAQGKLGHFGDWPHALGFNIDLLQCQAELGRLRIVLLRADREVVSHQYGYVFGGCYYWRFNARATGPDWDHLGLGNLSLVEETRALIPEGVRSIEAGFGHYQYKVVWGAKEHPLRTLLVVASRRGARLRSRVFTRLASWLNLFYYRIWFQRVAPKLPLARRPLWKLWIRTRL